jgi:hypothetical protein
MKSMTKSESLRRHAKKRARERYQLDINKFAYKSLVDDILSGRAQKIERQTHRVTTYLIQIEGAQYPIAFDKLRKEIITFLPQEYRKTI